MNVRSNAVIFSTKTITVKILRVSAINTLIRFETPELRITDFFTLFPSTIQMKSLVLEKQTMFTAVLQSNGFGCIICERFTSFNTPFTDVTILTWDLQTKNFSMSDTFFVCNSFLFFSFITNSGVSFASSGAVCRIRSPISDLRCCILVFWKLSSIVDTFDMHSWPTTFGSDFILRNSRGGRSRTDI